MMMLLLAVAVLLFSLDEIPMQAVSSFSFDRASSTFHHRVAQQPNLLLHHPYHHNEPLIKKKSRLKSPFPIHLRMVGSSDENKEKKSSSPASFRSNKRRGSFFGKRRPSSSSSSSSKPRQGRRRTPSEATATATTTPKEPKEISSVAFADIAPTVEKQQQQQQTRTTTAATSLPAPKPRRNIPRKLDAHQQDFILGYLNKHHSDLLLLLAEAFSPLGTEMAKANAMSGGSYRMESAKILSIDSKNIKLQVEVQKRVQRLTKKVAFSINAPPVSSKRFVKYRSSTTEKPVPDDENTRLPVDDVLRRLCHLCGMVGQPSVTGKLVQLALQLGGSGVGKIPENLYLNQVPHNRYLRQHFYDETSQAVLDAVVMCGEGQLSNRMKVVSLFPELNTGMDSYRIGTLLELARAITIRLAEENLRVRLCVQGSMGQGIFTGVPKVLNGASTLIQRMDWQSNAGEVNEGMVGDYVRFGAVGPEHVLNEMVDSETGQVAQYQDDAFVLIAPQSMLGLECSIIPILKAMVEAAGDRPVILINPDLTDKVSAQGQQSVRGRQERMDFAATFQTIYHFENLYPTGASYFPIIGAMTKLNPHHPWVAHQRRDYANEEDGEVYVPVVAGETMPSRDEVLRSFDR